MPPYTPYSFIRTIVKGLLPIIGGGIAGVFSGFIDATPGTWEEFINQLPELIVLLGAGLIPVLQNLWKTRDKAGNPINYISKLLGFLVVILFLSSCATNGSYLRETITDLDGNVTTTEMKTQSMVTAWAEQEEGSGSADYEWTPEGGGHITVGQAAIGQKANMPLEQILNVLLPVLMNMSTPQPQQPGWQEQVIQLLREHPEIITNAQQPRVAP